MDWINEFQLFLLDFDGLLVNTESLHYQAYIRMCQQRGHQLNWTFDQFCEAAHYDSKLLRIKLQEALPELFVQEPDWSTLYTEKKKLYLQILGEKKIELMPGAEKFLTALKENGIKRVVVTHSPIEQVQYIRDQHPVLQTIKHWITREDYELSKPHPEPYLTAIDRHSSKGDKIIGFEDSPRGIAALLGTSAKAVLINPSVPKKIEPLISDRKIAHFGSIADITKEKLLEEEV